MVLNLTFKEAFEVVHALRMRASDYDCSNSRVLKAEAEHSRELADKLLSQMMDPLNV